LPATVSDYARRPLAVRMGLRYVKGLAVREADALLTSRDERSFTSMPDLARRTGLPHDALRHLAEAGALAPLVGDRRQALWQVHALARRRRSEQLELPLADPSPAPALAPLTEHETITWDWERTEHSPRGHLLEPVRADLRALGLPTAAEVADLADGARAHYAGVVICRQRPATAKDVTFMTLEDETGFVNLVLWARVYEEHRLLAKTRSFLGVTGRIQSEDSVVHLVVESLWEPRLPRSPLAVGSRDFH
jgi:error-prone DNA polymerase